MAVRAALLSSSLLLVAFCFLTNAKNPNVETVFLDAVLPPNGCNIPTASVKARAESSLEIVNLKDPCSGKTLTEEAHHATLAKDSLRVASIQKKVLGGRAATGSEILSSNPVASGLNIGSSIYTIGIYFGTPRKAQTVIVDTGSDVIWIQCKPCLVMCYPQKDPLFDPGRSSTYRNFSCHSSTCEGLPRQLCYEGNCHFFLDYGDGSYITGFLASDTFRMNDRNFKNITFGCGQQDKGFSETAAGLLGLGRSNYSLNSQVAYVYKNIFYYCLPSTGKGYIGFGNPKKTPSGYTPMLTDPRAPSLYFLNLTGITVYGTKVDIPFSVFQPTGTIIDSGTEITRLPAAAYSALRAIFVTAMAQYPPAAAFNIMDTCYDFSKNDSVTYPIFIFHYEGVDVRLHWSSLFYVVSPQQTCLALAANSDSSHITIIGSIQQRAKEIVYDNERQRIGFAEGTCA